MISVGLKHIKHAFGFALISAMAAGQNDKVKRDSSNLDIKRFRDEFKEKYSGDDFNYEINDTGGVNLMQRILRKFFRWLSDVFGFDIDFIDYKTLEYIIYGALGIILLYLIIKFLLQNPVSSVFKTETKTIEGFKYVEEDIAQADFEKLIKQAVKNKNFRLATRYMYLKCLKSLASKNVIEWHFDKTNKDYLNEIKDASLKEKFRRISYIYDYIWYGEFPIDEGAFNKNKIDFNVVLKSSNNG